MPLFTETELLQALRDCYDPELPCNIVDLGLVYGVAIAPDLHAPGATVPGVPERYCVQITLLPRMEDEAATAQISAQIGNRLAGLESVSQTEVLFREQPRWSPLRITPAGRRVLGLDGNRNLVQIR